MDAKPQRPLRALRVRDENAVPAAAQTKSLHQRNKSTSALSTLAQYGGVKPGPKRTVFADVSNTVRTAQPAKDDMILPAKGTYDLAKKAAEVSVQEFTKSTALLRPAQRPLSTITAKNAVNNPPTNASAAQKLVVADSSIAANIRKVLSKRSTTIFKELSPPVEELPHLSDVKETRSRALTAPIQHTLPPVRENPVPEADEEQAKSITTETVAVTVTDAKQNAPEETGRDTFADASTTLVESIKDSSIPTKTDEQRSYPHAEASLESHDAYYSAPVHSHDQVEYLQTLEEQAILVEYERNEELARLQSQSQPRPEPEEYWEEEEEEEYYEADGYTTARSLPSRGDNTTGGVTIVLAPRVTAKVERELVAAKDFVESTKTAEDIEDEAWDTSMVAEYGDEIFDYMRQLEERMRPNPYYMDNQAEIQWSMRSVLMDWLVQVHHRFNLLPETLFLSVNYVDRFLSCKVVSLNKLQLVGATAIFVAAKYEEINCPSVQEIVYMVDSGYSVDEILKAERFMLSMLQFELGWPGPMSFLRRISKADDYDLETRTLAKYFLEITIMDERFVGCAPSFTAAAAHCLARFMLRKGDWSPAHVYYSNYTLSQLRHLLSVMLECCEHPQKHHSAVYDKYADKRYKKASRFVEGELANGFQLPFASGETSSGCAQSWRRR
ncbi:hypothetical protein W97_03343 [Coniosporium apollinis CBS 100218]|uniref:Uncharacterized protein n=1 Tax=Coniosporium apollinis (strain CBS 100218) TaxID=1168221 RepID=R7YQK0_CONA1|nr:uncharacterized protein W97_03343 [Coniosporium apollinis CBS 100218]EON64113.1 hypothetical protein W97_03343 [Coniosporium apollinis CBS 100218]